MISSAGEKLENNEVDTIIKDCMGDIDDDGTFEYIRKYLGTRLIFQAQFNYFFYFSIPEKVVRFVRTNVYVDVYMTAKHFFVYPFSFFI